MRKLIEYGDVDSIMYLLGVTIEDLFEFLDEDILEYYIKLVEVYDETNDISDEDVKHVQKLLLTYEDTAKDSYHIAFRQYNIRMVK